MSKTAIQWTDETLNPARGCEAISPGCLNCYAARMATRFSGEGQIFEGLARMKPQPNDRQGRPRPSLAVWTGDVTLVPKALRQALSWSPKISKRVFVGSVTDIFHREVPFEYLCALFAVMAATPHVTYQLVTKRPARMVEFFEWLEAKHRVNGGGSRIVTIIDRARRHGAFGAPLTPREEQRLVNAMVADRDRCVWPLPNVHLLVSAENQEMLDERVPLLLDCPAVVHGISAEPLLGSLDIRPYLRAKFPRGPGLLNGRAYGRSHGENVLRWVISGGESGPGARPCEVEWHRDLRWQIIQANAEHIERQEPGLCAFFPKQLGSCAVDAANGLAGAAVHVPDEYTRPLTHRLKDSHGGDESEWPVDLQGLRAFPVPA